MTLMASGSLGVGETIQEELHNKWDTIDDVEIELIKMGLGPLEKPHYSFTTMTPGTVERMSNDELTRALEMYQGWHSFSANMLSRVRGRIGQCDNEMKVLAAKLRSHAVQTAKQLGDKKPAEDAIKEQIMLNPRYQDIMIDVQKAEQMRFQLEGWVDSFSLGIRIISRQVELRRQSLEQLNLPTGTKPPGRL